MIRVCFKCLDNYRNELTGSDFKPYFNQIQFYRSAQDIEEPVIIANVPRNIQKRDDMDLIITFRLDA